MCSGLFGVAGQGAVPVVSGLGHLSFRWQAVVETAVVGQGAAPEGSGVGH